MVDPTPPATSASADTNGNGTILSKIVSTITILILAISIGGIGGADFSVAYYHHEVTLVHLLTFTSWFGCSIWVTFIAGIVMFNNLPRHVFGRLQAKLFPAYFIFSALVVALSIMSAAALGWEVKSLGIILVTILMNVSYFEPETTRIMILRHAVERRLKTGHEIGQLRPSDPTKANDPELKALSKKFGMLHGVSTTLNMVALGFGCYWLNFIASLVGDK
mmetsp:Transcript_9294/g.16821  ORF Transcript_9294/g.16821 Transcript_9294/m.16821 type:complete len:220 (-) Transcript_9294:237-896(-)